MRDGGKSFSICGKGPGFARHGVAALYGLGRGQLQVAALPFGCGFCLAAAIFVGGRFTVGAKHGLNGLPARWADLPDSNVDYWFFVVDVTLVFERPGELAETAFGGVHFPGASEVGPDGVGRREPNGRGQRER